MCPAEIAENAENTAMRVSAISAFSARIISYHLQSIHNQHMTLFVRIPNTGYPIFLELTMIWSTGFAPLLLFFFSPFG